MRIALLTACLLLSTALSAQESDDELTEAKGLEPEKTSQKTVQKGSSPWNIRGYGLLDWRTRKGRSGQRTYAPNGEFSLALSSNWPNSTQVFAEGRVFYLQEGEKTSGILDQAGLRWRPAEHWVLALGKERNRRAPGLIISPSDFIHPHQSAPGLPEDRSGVWLTRLSWETEQQSLDLVFLPVSRITDSGLPDERSQYLGTVARWFGRFSGYDLTLDAGTMDDAWKSGASVQTFFFKTWKTYVEAGYDDERERGSALFGVSYEGSDDFGIRGEVYHNADSVQQSPRVLPSSADAANAVTVAPAEAANSLFLRNDYFIGNISLIEYRDRFNVKETWIKSLQDAGYVNILSLEYIVGDRNLASLTWIRISGDESTQYALRPFDWQALASWKYSF